MEDLYESGAPMKPKADFLSMVSHELRSPLMGVLGMAELLSETELTVEQREYTDTICSAGQALLSLINDVLDFSKIEAGKLNLETIDFDLRTTVEEVIKLLAVKAHKKGLEVACLIPADLPQTLRGDPGRLRQILTNLVDNAVKFTKQGDVLVRAIVERESVAHIILRLEVVDTGVGIEPEARAKLFQPFSQADSSVTRKYGGTGLGLAICKRLIDLMGGQIGIESEVGRGSTFWFTIKLTKQQVKVRNEGSPRVDLRGLQALVVARNATIYRVLEQDLTHWGVHVVACEDDSKALAFLEDAAACGEPCDLALLDMPIPDMDAFDFARTIKADPTLSRTRLVFLTSLGHRGQAKEAQEAGFVAYLSKPVGYAQLYQCLVTVMGTPATAHVQEVNPAGLLAKPPLVTKHTLKEAETRAQPRILVVHDCIVDQKVVVQMLERLGYQTDIATNGQEALEVLVNPQVRYAAVLIDWHKHAMGCSEFISEIRQREGVLRHVPIIAMSSKVAEGDREQHLETGVDEYIPKPVRLDQLDAVIQCCRNKSLPKQPGENPTRSPEALESEAVRPGTKAS